MKIKEKIELVNLKFGNIVDLKYKIFERELIDSKTIGRSLLIKLNKECECVQKIYYGRGCNSYKLYAPVGFVDYLKKEEYKDGINK